jgi:hypothetical protein
MKRGMLPLGSVVLAGADLGAASVCGCCRWVLPLPVWFFRTICHTISHTICRWLIANAESCCASCGVSAGTATHHRVVPARPKHACRSLQTATIWLPRVAGTWYTRTFANLLMQFLLRKQNGEWLCVCEGVLAEIRMLRSHVGLGCSATSRITRVLMPCFRTFAV